MSRMYESCENSSVFWLDDVPKKKKHSCQETRNESDFYVQVALPWFFKPGFSGVDAELAS